MSKYKQYEQSRQSFGINVLGTLIVEVEADNGQTGFAVSTAGEMGCFIVEKHPQPLYRRQMRQRYQTDP